LRSSSWLTPDTLLVRLFHTIYNPGSLPAQRMVVSAVEKMGQMSK